MHCPRCHTAELAARDRSGIEIDICPSCRGVWLDRGELDKLVAREREGARDDDDHDDDDRRGRGKRRSSWFDIFD